MTTNKQILIESKSAWESNTIRFFILIIALLATSLTPIFIKVSVSEVSAKITLFNRLWIATIIFGLWSGISQVQTDSSDQETVSQQLYQSIDIVLLIAVAFVHVLGRFLFTWSLTQTSAANANVLCNMTAPLTTLGGWLFFNQRFDRRFLIGMVFAIVGVTSLGFEDSLKSTNNLIGDATALTSSLFYASSFLILEQIRSKFSVASILLWRCFIGALLMLPGALIFEEQIFPISLSSWLAVIGLAAISEALGHGLLVYSLKHFSSAFVTLFMLLDLPIVALLAWIIFSESLSLLNLLGFGLIVEGIYLAKTGKGAEIGEEGEVV